LDKRDERNGFWKSSLRCVGSKRIHAIVEGEAPEDIDAPDSHKHGSIVLQALMPSTAMESERLFGPVGRLAGRVKAALLEFLPAAARTRIVATDLRFGSDVG
jgi:hypothetical protein